MLKVGMKEIRKPQPIQAAIDELGFSNATVSIIGKNAGVSSAIINYYFDGKTACLKR